MNWRSRATWILGCIALWIAGLAVRVPYLPDLCHSDLNYYTAWTYRMLDQGLGNVYSKGGVYQQVDGREVRLPPCNNGVGHLSIFYVTGRFLFPAITGKDFTLETAAFVLDEPDTPSKRWVRILFKLPAVIAELLTATLLLCWLTPRFGPGWGFTVAGVLAVHPAMVHNSAIWGQIDAWHTLSLCLCVISLMQRRYRWAGIWMTAALLFKLQAVFLLPVFFCCVMFGPSRGEPTTCQCSVSTLASFFQQIRWHRVKSVGFICLMLAGLAWAPWLLTGAGRHILDPYLRTVGQYRYTTVNAFNVYWLIENWDRSSPVDFTQATDDRQAWFSIVGTPVSYRLAGTTLFGLFSLATAIGVYRKAFSSSSIAIAAFLQSLSLFLFATEMHERYLYPAVALWVLSFRPTVGWWSVWAIVGLAVTANAMAYFSPLDGFGHHLFSYLAEHRIETGQAVAVALLAIWLCVFLCHTVERHQSSLHTRYSVETSTMATGT